MIEVNLPQKNKGCYHAHSIEYDDQQKLGTNGNPYGGHNKHHCNLERLGYNLDRDPEMPVPGGMV